MLTYYRLDELSRLSSEVDLDLVAAPVIANHHDAGCGNFVHVLQALGLVCVVQVEREFKDGLVFSGVACKRNFGEDAVHDCYVVSWALLGGNGHELEFYDSAHGSHDVVNCFWLG